MSSWMRDMAKKPPAEIEPMPVFESSTNSEPMRQLMRSFEPLELKKQSQSPSNNLFVEPMPLTPPVMRTFVHPIEAKKKTPILFLDTITELKKKELMHTFESPSRLSKQVSPKTALPEPVAPKSNQAMLSFDPPSRLQKKDTKVKVQSEPWAPLDVKKKKEQILMPPIKQLNRPNDPQVTVLIDVNGNFEFTEPFLQSLARQTYTKWVGLISLRTKDDQIKLNLTESLIKLQLSNLCTVIDFPVSLSVSDSYRELSLRAETPYIALAKNTDLWVSKKLDKQLEAIANDTNIGIVGTMARLFGDKVELADVPPGTLNATDFITNNPLIFSSVLLKKGLIDFSNEFNNFDFDCWLKQINNDIKITNVSDILTLQRVHTNIVSDKSDDKDAIRKKHGI